MSHSFALLKSLFMLLHFLNSSTSLLAPRTTKPLPPEGVPDPGIAPDWDDRHRTIDLSGLPDISLAILGVSYHRLYLHAQGMHSFEQWLEIEFVVHVAWGDSKGDGQLGLGAAGNVHPVFEDEDPFTPPHPRVGVAPPGLVVLGSLTEGLDVDIVNRDDVSLHCTLLQQPLEQVVEDPVVSVLSKAVSEVGKEVVAGCLLPESACSGYLSIVFET